MFKIFKRDDSGTEQPLQQIEVTISSQTILQVLTMVFGFILLIAAVKQAGHALLLVFISFFLALALNGPVQGIGRRLPGSLRGKRSVATAFSFLVVILFLAAFLASIVPPLVRQTENFVNSAPSLLQGSQDQNSDIGKLIHRYHLEDQVSNLSSDLGSRLRGLSGSAVATVGRVGSSIFSTLTILVLTFMMLIEGPRIVEFASELIPERHRPTVRRLSGDMYRVIRGYINGQVTLAALAAVLIVPALFALHIRYPIALMVVIFICGLIPMVGHTIGAIIVTLVALATSPVSAIIILCYYILYQQIENYIIQPRIQANSTDMSPLFVFISVVIGVTFGGLVGGLFAIPVAGCIRIFFLDYLITHHYISDTETPVVEHTVKKAKS